MSTWKVEQTYHQYDIRNSVMTHPVRLSGEAEISEEAFSVRNGDFEFDVQ